MATSFGPGTLIIPADPTHQPGVFRAYGLVHALLRADVPVRWIIRAGKTSPDGVDFSVEAPAVVTDREPGATLGMPPSYAGGPWVVDAADATPRALAVVDAWLASDDVTRVHQLAGGTFTADVARTLVAAPTLGVFNDGAGTMAFDMLNAAGIPDDSGAAWANTSADHVAETALAGPTAAGGDGALFVDGQPAWCHLSSLHYLGGSRAGDVTAEIRAWLTSSGATQLFAQCESVDLLESSSAGRFITTAGVERDGNASVRANTAVFSADHPLNQFTGTFTAGGGSRPSYMPAAGSAFRPGAQVLVQETGQAAGRRLVWMAGHVDGDPQRGVVAYLGGHTYAPGTAEDAAGVRVFLDSVLHAPCATPEHQPAITLEAGGPQVTATAQVTWTWTWRNSGAGPAQRAVLVDELPVGVVVQSAGGSPRVEGTRVTWTLGTLSPGASGTVEVTVVLPAPGVHQQLASMAYRAWGTPRTLDGTFSTEWIGGGSSSSSSAASVLSSMSSSAGSPSSSSGDASSTPGSAVSASAATSSAVASSAASEAMTSSSGAMSGGSSSGVTSTGGGGTSSGAVSAVDGLAPAVDPSALPDGSTVSGGCAGCVQQENAPWGWLAWAVLVLRVRKAAWKQPGRREVRGLG